MTHDALYIGGRPRNMSAWADKYF